MKYLLKTAPRGGDDEIDCALIDLNDALLDEICKLWTLLSLHHLSEVRSRRGAEAWLLADEVGMSFGDELSKLAVPDNFEVPEGVDMVADLIANELVCLNDRCYFVALDKRSDMQYETEPIYRKEIFALHRAVAE